MIGADTTITLIGTRLAKIGTEFFFNGQTPDCEGCRLKNTCMNLNKGSKYRIVSIRNSAKHDCAVHDSGVCAVEVVEAPLVVAIESRKAFNGSKIVFEPIQCENTCSLYKLCHPMGLEKGDKGTITGVVGDAPETCPKGYSLKVVELSRA